MAENTAISVENFGRVILILLSPTKRTHKVFEIGHISHLQIALQKHVLTCYREKKTGLNSK